MDGQLLVDLGDSSDLGTDIQISPTLEDYRLLQKFNPILKATLQWIMPQCGQMGPCNTSDQWKRQYITLAELTQTCWTRWLQEDQVECMVLASADSSSLAYLHGVTNYESNVISYNQQYSCKSKSTLLIDTQYSTTSVPFRFDLPQ